MYSNTRKGLNGVKPASPVAPVSSIPVWLSGRPHEKQPTAGKTPVIPQETAQAAPGSPPGAVADSTAPGLLSATGGPVGADDWPADCVPADWTCTACGGLLWWEDLRGGRHCMDCESGPLRRSLRLAERAAAIRASFGRHCGAYADTAPPPGGNQPAAVPTRPVGTVGAGGEPERTPGPVAGGPGVDTQSSAQSGKQPGKRRATPDLLPNLLHFHPENPLNR